VIKIVNNIPFGLQYLNLSFNQNLGPEGADELRDVVLEDVRYQLDSLVLEDCRLGDEGAAILGQALRLNDKLRFLDMSNNGITGKGAEEFCERLTESYLRVVFMHWNPLGSKGGQAFARALKTNSDLQVLDLSFCGMGQAREQDPMPAAERQALNQAARRREPRERPPAIPLSKE